MNTAADQNPDEFNESAPVQPGTQVDPGAPATSPEAPNTEPQVPDTPTDNSEQEDESTQAQTVADDAIRSIPNAEAGYGGDSEHGGITNPAQIIPDDEQDVVDHMQQMERSGRIDMGAFAGERSDDDEPGMFGEDGLEPGEFDENGSLRSSEEQYLPIV